MVLAQSVLRFSTQGAFVVIKWARNRRHIEGFSSFSRDAPSHLHNIDVHGKQHSVHIDSCIDSNNAQRPWIINITQGLNEDGVAISSRCSEQHYLSRSLEKLHIAANGKYVIDLGSFFFFFLLTASSLTQLLASVPTTLSRCSWKRSTPIGLWLKWSTYDPRLNHSIRITL